MVESSAGRSGQPAGVALTDTTLEKDVFLNTAGNAYELLTEKAGPLEATLKFTVPVTKAAGISMVSFERLVGGSSTVDLKIDGEKADVKVPAAPWVKVDQNAAHAALPPGAPLQVTWERALPKLAAAPTKIYADTRTLVAVAEGVLVCQEDIDFSILHTGVRELNLAAPKAASILDVTGRGVQDWRAGKDGNILITLRGEGIGGVPVRVTFEAPATGESVEIPVVRVVGAERERGFVGVIALVNVEVAAGAVSGASAVDVKQLPADLGAMTRQPILLGFRYAEDKFTVPLTIKKHGEIGALATIADSASFTSMQLADGRRMTRALYTVRNNRNQFLRLQMPPAAALWSAAVGGETVSPGLDEKKNVLIPLIRSAASAQELASFPVELVYVETPDKAPPPAGKLHVELPRLDCPAMHVMVNYYLPAEGKYETPGGMFTAARSGFSGPLRVVAEFASMTTDRATAAAIPAQPQQQAQAMQKQFETKMDAEAKAAGATPIRVRLPVDGKLYKLEKILALPNDVLFVDVDYSGWTGK